MSGNTDEITVLTYNVQNIFDAVDNGTEYYEYDPGNGEWNDILYNTRLLNLSEVIKTSVKGGPDIIALQEVENLHVVTDLRELYLKGMGYRDIAATAKEDSAVQVAVISRIPFDSVFVHDISCGLSENLRPVLEVDFQTGTKRVYLFNNHWKSRIGGAFETEYQRRYSAMILKKRIESILETDPSAEIVALGDFNESHDEYFRTGGEYCTALIPFSKSAMPDCSGESIFLTGSFDLLCSTDRYFVMYDPWFNEQQNDGSYCYKGKWETIDHCLIAGVEGLPEFSVVRTPFLLTSDGIPAGWNKKTGAGYSDHLPLLLKLITE